MRAAAGVFLRPWTPLLLGGLGLLLSGLPAQARVQPTPGGPPQAEVAKAEAALALLGRAASAARARSYSGTQYLVTYRAGSQSSGVVRVRHVPGVGMDVTPTPTASENGLDVVSGVRSDVLDEQAVRLLGRHYRLAVAAPGACAGRSTHVVEAQRPTGSGVAGRFWIDTRTGLVLRREVYDGRGRTVRSSAFVDVRVSGPRADVRVVVSRPGDLVDPAQLGLEWPLALPGSLELVEARSTSAAADGRRAQVLHLAYSDGLSRLSLFAQEGRLSEPMGQGFREERLHDRPVWVKGAAPERVVWSGGRRTWTLLSDAPAETVRAVVSVLPQDAGPDPGLLNRAGRGAARVGSWLNPFA